MESKACGDEAPEFLLLVLCNSFSVQEELGAFSLVQGDLCLSSLETVG